MKKITLTALLGSAAIVLAMPAGAATVEGQAQVGAGMDHSKRLPGGVDAPVVAPETRSMKFNRPTISDYPTYYSEWDADRDARLTRQEFETAYGESGLFDNWDADRDAALAREELHGGIFARWDVDSDGNVSQTEFSAANHAWFGDPRYENFSAWDDDGNGVITRAEFQPVVVQTDVYAHLDTDGDGRIERAEYAGSIWTLGDVDRDDQVAEGEFADSFGGWL